MRSRVCEVAGLLVIFSLIGCYSPPKEAQLIENFNSHRAEFNNLVTMATADRAFAPISAAEIPPRGMADSRFKEYKDIFRQLGIQNGINWGLAGHPDGFVALFSTSVPMGTKGRDVGYVYSSVPPDPIVSHLPISASPFEIRRDHGHEAFFRALDGEWYLFYDVSW